MVIPDRQLCPKRLLNHCTATLLCPPFDHLWQPLMSHLLHCPGLQAIGTLWPQLLQASLLTQLTSFLLQLLRCCALLMLWLPDPCLSWSQCLTGLHQACLMTADHWGLLASRVPGWCIV